MEQRSAGLKATRLIQKEPQNHTRNLLISVKRFQAKSRPLFTAQLMVLQQICSSSRVFTCLLSPSGPVSSDGGITNPICGGGFSVPQGQGASFFCRPSLFGQYVTIRSTRSVRDAFTLCEINVNKN